MLRNLAQCKNMADCTRLAIIVGLALFIQMFLLRYFWNKALVPHVSVLRSIPTLTDALMLSVGFGIVTLLM